MVGRMLAVQVPAIRRRIETGEAHMTRDATAPRARRRMARLVTGLLLSWTLAASGALPALPAAAAGPAPPLTAHYPLDEGAGTIAADVSGGGHGGALQGAAGWGDAISGRSALVLDGRTADVDVPSPVVD